MRLVGRGMLRVAHWAASKQDGLDYSLPSLYVLLGGRRPAVQLAFGRLVRFTGMLFYSVLFPCRLSGTLGVTAEWVGG